MSSSGEDAWARHRPMFDPYEPRIWVDGQPRLVRYGDFIDFADANTCYFQDFLQYDDEQNAVVTEGFFEETWSMYDWLSKDLRRKSESANSEDLNEMKSPSSGLRLILGTCEDRDSSDWTRLPLPVDEYEDLKSALMIPTEFERALGEPVVQSAKFTRHRQSRDIKSKGEPNDENRRDCYIFKIGIHVTGYYTVALSHDPKTNITHGVVFSQCEYGQLAKLATLLRENHGCCRQPLITVVYLAELVIRVCARKASASGHRLLELENDMGQHTWMTRPRGDPLKQDFAASTRSLNSTSTTLGTVTMRLEGLQLMLNMIQRKHVDFRRKGSLGKRRPFDVDLIERVEYCLNQSRNLLFRVAFEQRRTKSLLAVVYNHMALNAAELNLQIAADQKTIAASSEKHTANMMIIAESSQRDSITMKQIAIDTKRDSSAMKTIALLTMFFLPGTFVAAFFAMPLFNWDAAYGSSVFKNRFKYYWIVTIPLTVVVVICWFVLVLLPWRRWISRWRQQHKKNNDQHTRDIGD